MDKDTVYQYVKFFPFRLLLIAVAAVVEIALTVHLLDRLYTQFAWLETVLRVASVIILVWIVRNSRHLSSDLPWLLLIAAAPVLGTIIYLLLGADLVAGSTYRGVLAETEQAKAYYRQDPTVKAELSRRLPHVAGQFAYLLNDDLYPTYRNTGLAYYSLGELGFPQMLEDLGSAEHFIFLEYFIIERGRMWDALCDALVRKVKEGVDVRVIYDDIGSVGTLPGGYARELERLGIKCVSFNRLHPLVNIFLNHRDHRKIMVIDGRVAYTGGINLADEYVNLREKYGHWKDNVLRVTGEAVWSFTVMFLTTWNALRHEDVDFEPFRAQPLPGEADGFVAPYGETPLDTKTVGRNVYLNILGQAREYCYIMTPYLIIDTEMRNALMRAAERGVDVRIVCPGVPDRRVIWDIGRSFYRQLIEGGVKIYEYVPGFVHAKVFVADDVVASVGTLNLDYRSLYLHFENGVLIGGAQAVEDVRNDVLATLELCHQMSAEESTRGIVREAALSVVRLFAPLL